MPRLELAEGPNTLVLQEKREQAQAQAAARESAKISTSRPSLGEAIRNNNERLENDVILNARQAELAVVRAVRGTVVSALDANARQTEVVQQDAKNNFDLKSRKKKVACRRGESSIHIIAAISTKEDRSNDIDPSSDDVRSGLELTKDAINNIAEKIVKELGSDRLPAVLELGSRGMKELVEKGVNATLEGEGVSLLSDAIAKEFEKTVREDQQKVEQARVFAATQNQSQDPEFQAFKEKAVAAMRMQAPRGVEGCVEALMAVAAAEGDRGIQYLSDPRLNQELQVTAQSVVNELEVAFRIAESVVGRPELVAKAREEAKRFVGFDGRVGSAATAFELALGGAETNSAAKFAQFFVNEPRAVSIDSLVSTEMGRSAVLQEVKRIESRMAADQVAESVVGNPDLVAKAREDAKRIAGPDGVVGSGAALFELALGETEKRSAVEVAIHLVTERHAVDVKSIFCTEMGCAAALQEARRIESRMVAAETQVKQFEKTTENLTIAQYKAERKKLSVSLKKDFPEIFSSPELSARFDRTVESFQVESLQSLAMNGKSPFSDQIRTAVLNNPEDYDNVLKQFNINRPGERELVARIILDTESPDIERLRNEAQVFSFVGGKIPLPLNQQVTLATFEATLSRCEKWLDTPEAQGKLSDETRQYVRANLPEILRQELAFQLDYTARTSMSNAVSSGKPGAHTCDLLSLSIGELISKYPVLERDVELLEKVLTVRDRHAKIGGPLSAPVDDIRIGALTNEAKIERAGYAASYLTGPAGAMFEARQSIEADARKMTQAYIQRSLNEENPGVPSPLDSAWIAARAEAAGIGREQVALRARNAVLEEFVRAPATTLALGGVKGNDSLIYEAGLVHSSAGQLGFSQKEIVDAMQRQQALVTSKLDELALLPGSRGLSPDERQQMLSSVSYATTVRLTSANPQSEEAALAFRESVHAAARAAATTMLPTSEREVSKALASKRDQVAEQIVSIVGGRAGVELLFSHAAPIQFGISDGATIERGRSIFEAIVLGPDASKTINSTVDAALRSLDSVSQRGLTPEDSARIKNISSTLLEAKTQIDGFQIKREVTVGNCLTEANNGLVWLSAGVKAQLAEVTESLPKLISEAASLSSSPDASKNITGKIDGALQSLTTLSRQKLSEDDAAAINGISASLVEAKAQLDGFEIRAQDIRGNGALVLKVRTLCATAQEQLTGLSPEVRAQLTEMSETLPRVVAQTESLSQIKEMAVLDNDGLLTRGLAMRADLQRQLQPLGLQGQTDLILAGARAYAADQRIEYWKENSQRLDTHYNDGSMLPAAGGKSQPLGAQMGFKGEGAWASRELQFALRALGTSGENLVTDYKALQAELSSKNVELRSSEEAKLRAVVTSLEQKKQGWQQVRLYYDHGKNLCAVLDGKPAQSLSQVTDAFLTRWDPDWKQNQLKEVAANDALVFSKVTSDGTEQYKLAHIYCVMKNQPHFIDRKLRVDQSGQNFLLDKDAERGIPAQVIPIRELIERQTMLAEIQVARQNLGLGSREVPFYDQAISYCLATADQKAPEYSLMGAQARFAAQWSETAVVDKNWRDGGGMTGAVIYTWAMLPNQILKGVSAGYVDVLAARAKSDPYAARMYKALDASMSESWGAGWEVYKKTGELTGAVIGIGKVMVPVRALAGTSRAAQFASAMLVQGAYAYGHADIEGGLFDAKRFKAAGIGMAAGFLGAGANRLSSYVTGTSKITSGIANSVDDVASKLTSGAARASDDVAAIATRSVVGRKAAEFVMTQASNTGIQYATTMANGGEYTWKDFVANSIVTSGTMYVRAATRSFNERVESLRAEMMKDTAAVRARVQKELAGSRERVAEITRKINAEKPGSVERKQLNAERDQLNDQIKFESRAVNKADSLVRNIDRPATWIRENLAVKPAQAINNSVLQPLNNGLVKPFVTRVVDPAMGAIKAVGQVVTYPIRVTVKVIDTGVRVVNTGVTAVEGTVGLAAGLTRWVVRAPFSAAGATGKFIFSDSKLAIKFQEKAARVEGHDAAYSKAAKEAKLLYREEVKQRILEAKQAVETARAEFNHVKSWGGKWAIDKARILGEGEGALRALEAQVKKPTRPRDHEVSKEVKSKASSMTLDELGVARSELRAKILESRQDLDAARKSRAPLDKIREKAKLLGELEAADRCYQLEAGRELRFRDIAESVKNSRIGQGAARIRDSIRSGMNQVSDRLNLISDEVALGLKNFGDTVKNSRPIQAVARIRDSVRSGMNRVSEALRLDAKEWELRERSTGKLRDKLGTMTESDRVKLRQRLDQGRSDDSTSESSIRQRIRDQQSALLKEEQRVRNLVSFYDRTVGSVRQWFAENGPMLLTPWSTRNWARPLPIASSSVLPPEPPSTDASAKGAGVKPTGSATKRAPDGVNPDGTFYWSGGKSGSVPARPEPGSGTRAAGSEPMSVQAGATGSSRVSSSTIAPPESATGVAPAKGAPGTTTVSTKPRAPDGVNETGDMVYRNGGKSSGVTPRPDPGNVTASPSDSATAVAPAKGAPGKPAESTTRRVPDGMNPDDTPYWNGGKSNNVAPRPGPESVTKPGGAGEIAIEVKLPQGQGSAPSATAPSLNGPTVRVVDARGNPVGSPSSATVPPVHSLPVEFPAASPPLSPLLARINSMAKGAVDSLTVKEGMTFWEKASRLARNTALNAAFLLPGKAPAPVSIASPGANRPVAMSVENVGKASGAGAQQVQRAAPQQQVVQQSTAKQTPAPVSQKSAPAQSSVRGTPAEAAMSRSAVQSEKGVSTSKYESVVVQKGVSSGAVEASSVKVSKEGQSTVVAKTSTDTKSEAGAKVTVEKQAKVTQESSTVIPQINVSYEQVVVSQYAQVVAEQQRVAQTNRSKPEEKSRRRREEEEGSGYFVPEKEKDKVIAEEALRKRKSQQVEAQARQERVDLYEYMEFTSKPKIDDSSDEKDIPLAFQKKATREVQKIDRPD